MKTSTRLVFSTILVTLALALTVWNIHGQSLRVTPTPDTWSAGGALPANVMRSVGVYFPTNGMLYAMGGRASDTAGSDRTVPLEYNPGTNAWAPKAGTYPDNQVNNMACGALTVAGTPQIYCVGGSAAGGTTATARVFSYNPVTETVTALTAADNWPGNSLGNILPGGFAVVSNKLYIVGGFQINTMMTQQTWQFDPTQPVGSRWLQRADYPVQRGYIPTTVINGLIYTAGGPSWDGTTLVDSADSFKYDPVANVWSAIANTPRAGGETRALAVNKRMWVLGGGRTTPNPSMQVDIYTPSTNTWTTGQPFATARRNFAADTDGSRVWLAGGYDSTGTGFLSSTERFLAPAATSAVSRKLHGGTPFDVNLPLTGNPGIECRNSGQAHTIIVNFGASVTVTGAQIIEGTGVVGSATASGSQVTVSLTGVTNAQRLTVLLNNVNDGVTTGDVAVTMGVLSGDTNGNGQVNAGDVSQTKSQIGSAVSAANFRNDVNVSNSITASDVSAVKTVVGTGLPQ